MKPPRPATRNDKPVPLSLVADGIGEGQIRVMPDDDGVDITVMPAPYCFSCQCVLSPSDARAIAEAILKIVETK